MLRPGETTLPVVYSTVYMGDEIGQVHSENTSQTVASSIVPLSPKIGLSKIHKLSSHGQWRKNRGYLPCFHDDGAFVGVHRIASSCFQGPGRPEDRNGILDMFLYEITGTFAIFDGFILHSALAIQ